MTFSASLRLNSKEFKKGISDVQRSLKSLQSSFLSVAGALGLGMSLNRLGNALMDTATKMSVAKNTLKNVSKEFGEYGQSLEWLRKISNKYGQDMITLTNSFAQFRAAAESSSLTLDEMRTIYESLTRAAGAYHMSADRTNDMMIAVTQMLSKGKVAAEELRRQLGNSLPGAFNLMTQAAYNAGIITENSTAALEKAMKSGEVMAEDVLPSFAKVLNDVTANADFSSLQTSLNRLKNTWTEVVEAGNFENLYQNIIDGAQKLLSNLQTNFWPKITAGFAGVLGGPAVFRGLTKMSSQVKSEAATMTKELANLKAAHNNFRQNVTNNYDAILTKMQAMGRNNKPGQSYFGLGSYNAKDYMQSAGGISRVSKEYLKAANAAREYNQQLLDINKLSRQLYGRSIISDKSAREIANVNKQLDGLLVQLHGTTRQTKLFAGATKVLTAAWKGFAAVLKTAFASLAIGAVIAGITYLVGKIIEARKEAKELANMAWETEKAVKETSVAENDRVRELTNIKTLLNSINEETDEAAKVQLINEVNKALGRSGDALFNVKSSLENEVIPAIDEYIRKLTTAAQQTEILSQIGNLQTEKLKLQEENTRLKNDPNYGKTEAKNIWGGSPTVGGAFVTTVTGLTKEAQGLEKKLQDNNKRLEQIDNSIYRIAPTLNPDFNGPVAPWQANSETIATILGLNPTKKGGTGNQGPQGGGGGSKEDTPKDVLDKYKKELRELNNQFDAGAVDAASYKESVAKLNEKTFQDLAAFGWDNAIKGLKTDADKSLAEDIRKTVVDAYLESLDDPALSAGIDEEIQDEADKRYDAWSDAWRKYLDFIKKNPPKERDSSSDYMYSKKRKKGQTYSEYEQVVTEENLDLLKDKISELESKKDEIKEAIKAATNPKEVELYNKALDDVLQTLGLLGRAAADLQTKVNVAKLESDIADLREQGVNQLFSDVTTLSDGMDKLYRAVQSVKQINDSTWKSEDLENFITKMNALIQVLEVLKTLYSALKTTEEIYGKIKEKNAAKAIALNTAEAASESAKATAAAGAAAAAGASSVAGVPIAGPALAVAAVAAIVTAILAGMKKFAKGGIVGGNTLSGDKQLARVNSREMILTTAQQRNLLDLANGKGGLGGNVQFTIRGADLVGTLNNYSRLRK